MDIFRAYLHDIELALVQETFGSIPATRAQRADSVNLQPMVNDVDDLNFFLRVKKESVPEHTSGAVGSMENDLDDSPPRYLDERVQEYSTR